MADELMIRPLRRDEWSGAMTLATRSFHREPFSAELFGTEPKQRFASAYRFYQSSSWYDDDLQLGAFVGPVLVGLCLVSPPGQCHACLHVDPDRPPEDPLFVLDWRFEVNVQAAHADLAPHAWLSRVIVEPALQGAGIGRTLIADSLARLRADGHARVVLECQPHRESFYSTLGFERVRTFKDPAGPDAMLMRIELSPADDRPGRD